MIVKVHMFPETAQQAIPSKPLRSSGRKDGEPIRAFRQALAPFIDFILELPCHSRTLLYTLYRPSSFSSRKLLPHSILYGILYYETNPDT